MPGAASAAPSALAWRGASSGSRRTKRPSLPTRAGAAAARSRRRDLSPRRADDLGGLVEIYRDELGYTALGHGHAIEAVHAGHGQRMVRDDEEARIGHARHLVHEIAEALHIRIVER